MFGSNRALAQKYIASGSLLQGLGRSFVRGLFFFPVRIYEIANRKRIISALQCAEFFHVLSFFCIYLIALRLIEEPSCPASANWARF